MTVASPQTAAHVESRSARHAAIVVAVALLSLLPRQAAAQLATCALVQDADLVALFGRSAEAKVNPINGDCVWGSVGTGRRGLTLTISFRDSAITTAGYTQGRTLAANNGPVTDEPQIGDHAYSAVVAYGATITVLTHGQIVQLRYANGVGGSAADVTRLRPVAASVISRLSARRDSTPAITGRPPS